MRRLFVPLFFLGGGCPFSFLLGGLGRWQDHLDFDGGLPSLALADVFFPSWLN